MNIPPSKKVVCITGTVWTGGRSAPRRMLIRDGFLRPIWFTTGRAISDAEFHSMSPAAFHLARSKSEVLVHIEHGGDFVGILKQDFEDAIVGARTGVLVAGPPEIAAQIAKAIPQTVIFVLKDADMELSSHLGKASRSGQMHRLDLNMLEPGVWDSLHKQMLTVLGLPLSQPRIF